MYGDVVMGIPHHDFENELSKLKQKAGAVDDTQLGGGTSGRAGQNILRTSCSGPTRKPSPKSPWNN